MLEAELGDTDGASTRRDAGTLPAIAGEFATTLRAELDDRQEAANAGRFANQFAKRSDVLIPRVFPEASTSRVLTIERLHGIKIDDLEGLAAAGIDRASLADRAARLLLEMVYTNGFFHADPHPGNFFVQSDRAIGLIDFGMGR
ncbi:MAG: AarF/ABC1/UbiB kinase family protein [Acidimicrobiales bacterium]|nr:AarF/ABC1/UbiB kinase family protein [Acidimicrobiales bacterium]